MKEENLPAAVVLHACCAPCSVAIVEWLTGQGVTPIIYYCNPNIFPDEEYERRKEELTRLCREKGLEVVDGDRDHRAWSQKAKEQGLASEPERGRRCLWCFTGRLTETARFAASRGIEVFTTTLASSRWKDLEQINAAGRAAESAVPGTRYWDRNWRRGGLTERRAQLVREYDFYRQQYCGCEFSMRREPDR